MTEFAEALPSITGWLMDVFRSIGSLMSSSVLGVVVVLWLLALVVGLVSKFIQYVKGREV